MLTRQLTLNAMDKLPGLTYYGIGLYGNAKPKTFDPEFTHQRSELLNHKAQQQIQHCLEFLSLRYYRPEHRKTINPNQNSYGLKHEVEAWLRKQNQPDTYISNGAFIAAAVGLGYKYRHRPGSPNLTFNLTPIRGLTKLERV